MAQPEAAARKAPRASRGHRLGLHPDGLGHKAGDVPLGQGNVQHAVVALGISADEGHVPVPALPPDHQIPDGGGGELRLLIHVPGPEHLDPLVVGTGHGLLGREQLGLQQGQVLVFEPGRPRQPQGGLHRHPVLLRRLGEQPPGPVHQSEQPGAVPVLAVGAQGHHHLVRPAQDLHQHLPLLGGEPLEGVHPHGAPGEEVAVLQCLGQTGQVVPGI